MSNVDSAQNWCSQIELTFMNPKLSVDTVSGYQLIQLSPLFVKIGHLLFISLFTGFNSWRALGGGGGGVREIVQSQTPSHRPQLSGSLTCPFGLLWKDPPCH
jgi:hypothetical protein